MRICCRLKDRGGARLLLAHGAANLGFGKLVWLLASNDDHYHYDHVDDNQESKCCRRRGAEAHCRIALGGQPRSGVDLAGGS